MTPGMPGSLHPSGGECQQVESHEPGVVRAVGTAELVDPRLDRGTEHVPLVRSEMDLVGLHHLAHEPAERTVAIERASLRDGVHEAALDAEAGIEQEVEVGAGVSERPRSGWGGWAGGLV